MSKAQALAASSGCFHRRLSLSNGVLLVAAILAGPTLCLLPAASHLTGKVLTVEGPVDPDTLGATIVQEHVFVNWNVSSDAPPVPATKVGFYLRPLTMDMLGAVIMGYPNRDNRILGSQETAIQELEEYKRQGGGAIVEVTSLGLGRDPQALARVSRATGVSIIMGTGWSRDDRYPSDLSERSVEDLTQEIIRDVTVGAEGTGIRAGVIGQVMTAGNELTAREIKVMRAAGRASRSTGAPLSVHAGSYLDDYDPGPILDLLESEGTGLGRVIVGHADSLVKDMRRLESVLKRGVYVGFSLLGEFPMLRQRATAAHVADGILELIRMGYLERLLLSPGVDQKVDLKSYGGTGYSFVLTQFVPLLKRKGVTRDQVHTLLVENPRRALTFAAPGPGGEQ